MHGYPVMQVVQYHIPPIQSFPHLPHGKDKGNVNIDSQLSSIMNEKIYIPQDHISEDNS